MAEHRSSRTQRAQARTEPAKQALSERDRSRDEASEGSATVSLWTRSAVGDIPAFPALEADTEADVAIVGGGITGLTAALLLAEAGKRVILVEARRLASGVSPRSTTHLTEAVDTRYAAIEHDFGAEGARLVAASSRAAIETMASIAERFAIPCDFLRRPGYLYSESEDDVDMLVKEHAAVRRAGIAADLLGAAPLPFATRGALVFPNQAQMHVQHYLAGVAIAAHQAGARIHEGSRVIAIEDGEPCTIHLENGPTVRAKHVFAATHAPLNRVFLQTKIAAYRSYVLAFASPTPIIGDGLFWDTADPYHYFSTFTVDGVSYFVVGGEDHKTGGKRDTTEAFGALAQWAGERFGLRSAGALAVPAPAFQWSAQVEEPVDGLPFIGRNAMSDNVFVATGFSGNGTTFGTIAALVLRDLVVGTKTEASAWAELYTATRTPVRSLSDYVAENVDFPMHLVSDHLKAPEAKSIDEIAPGEGKTVRVDGRRLAVYRDPSGDLHAVSSVCTHLGCTVKFNTAEKTWDCPCHGSRFDVEGAVLDGPAAKPLAKTNLGKRD